MKETLTENLYGTMLRIRKVEEAIADAYPFQEIRCPVHLSIGQEAVAVGVCSVLEQRDEVMSTHRSHAHYLAKGGSLRAMLAEMMGRQGGCAKGLGGSMHLIDKSCGFRGAVPIVGSTLPIATGLAFRHKLDRTGQVVAVFFGEGATEEGVFAESLNFAALHQLPILFVCEHNGYSVYSPMEVRQPSNRSITAIAAAHGLIARSIDGNSVLEVRQAVQEAVEIARMGKGPSLLECRTYRWREHCGPNYDNHIGYRTEAEFLEWKARCPIQRLASRIDPDRSREMEDAMDLEIKEAFEWVRLQPFASMENLTDLLEQVTP